MIIEDYIDFIDNNSDLTEGTDLFLNTFPDGVASGVFIESAGPVPQDKYIDIRDAVIRVTSIDASDIDEAYRRIMLVWNLLQHNQNLLLDHYKVYYLDATNVVDIARDIEGRPRFQFSATVRYRALSNVIS